jgi:hypothetical protein
MVNAGLVGNKIHVPRKEFEWVKMISVTGERGTRTESRELAAGVDGNSGMGAGLERTATRRRGKARRKMRLLVIQAGVVARAGI